MKITESKTRKFQITYSLDESGHVNGVIDKYANFVEAKGGVPLWKNAIRIGYHREIEIDADKADEVIAEISRYISEEDAGRVTRIDQAVVHYMTVSIEYSDVYKAVKLVYPNGSVKRYRTGRPDHDFKRAMEEARRFTRLFRIPAFTMSSVQHFVFDVPGWRFNDEDELVADDGG